MAMLEGTDRRDVLVGTMRGDEITGEEGNDVLLGLDRDDVLNGGADDDVLDGGDGDDVMIGGGGDDVLVAAQGDDNVDGGTGDDVYVVWGDRRDDVLISDTGGIDTLDFSGAQKGGTIDLAPGATSNVDKRAVTISGERKVSLPLDFVLSQDLSGSFSDDVVVVQDLAPKLYRAVNKFQKDSLFAVTSFIDKPTSPFGSTSDYEYQTDQALSGAKRDFINAIDGLELGSGGDFPEAQLTALLQIAVRETEIGFRSDSQKVVVLTTDAAYHEAGDFDSARANNGDGVLDGDPPGTGEDYPSVGQVARALQDAGIVPIFAVTSGQRGTYEALVEEFGFGTVVDLSSDSSDIIGAIREGIRDVSAAEIENAIGSDQKDKIEGNELDNRLEGRGGNDRIFGEEGDDVIVGGEGKDRMRGDDGADTFVVEGEDGRDRIDDFDRSEGDVIDMTALGIGFSDLSIGGGGNKAKIDYDGGRLILKGVDVADVDADFFLF